MNKVEAEKILQNTAESLFDLQNLNPEGDLIKQIQNGLQKKYKEHYQNQNYRISKDLSDKDIVNLIASKSENKDPGSPQISRQLPKFSGLYPNAGFECTLATAMSRLAFADAGYETRSLLLRRHFVAMRELEDGSIIVYDDATRITVDGETHGFTETFSPSEVTSKKDVFFENTIKGYVFTIKTQREIKNTEMFSKKVNSEYTKQFFAYEPEIFVDLAVVIENLSQFKNQNDADSVKLCKEYPVLKKLNYSEIKNALNLFDAYDYLD